MKSKNNSNSLPLYLFLLSIFPGISLLGLNIREIDVSTVWRSLMVSLLLMGIVFTVHRALLKQRKYAPLQTAVFLVLFFSYGHLYHYVLGLTGNYEETNWVHIPLIILFVLIYMLARHFRNGLNKQTSAINIISLVLVILPLIQIGQHSLSTRLNQSLNAADISDISQGEATPDIYYIVLDEYNRADNMLEIGFDNSLFENTLRDMGFFVANCSQSNYQRTAMSLAASLNMNYLYDAVPNDGRKDTNPKPVYQALTNNRVRRDLESRGYQTIAFQSGYRWGEWRDADIYYKPDNNLLFVKYLPPFENLFLESTLMKIAVDFDWLPFLNDTYVLYGEHYERVHYVLDTLPETAKLPGPKFVYAHLIVPHSPYVFLPDGSVNPDANNLVWTDTEGYITNVKFINAALEPVLRQIIEDSEEPPIILLQADHGTVFLPERRYFILNTYFLPGHEDVEIPHTITPVNSFRLVFNLYFGADYPYLKDVSIANDIGRPYKEVEKEFPPELSPCNSP